MKPAKFVVTLRDNTTKEVPLSTKQNRWEKLLDIFDKMPWSTIEAQDAEGKTLGIVEAEAEEEIEDDEDEGYDPVAAATERISKQMMQVMIVTQQETRKGYEATLKGLGDITRSMVDAAAMMREAYTNAMKLRDLAEVAGAGADGLAGSGENMMKLLMMASELMKGQNQVRPVTINVPPAKQQTSSPPRANGVAPKG